METKSTIRVVNMTMSDKKECLLCGCEGILMDDKIPGYQEPDFFSIYNCSNCNTSFSYPRIENTSVYDLIYNNGDSVPGYKRYWNYARNIKSVEDPLMYLAGMEEAYWGVKESLIRSVVDKNSAKILEVGSGLGYLTYALRKDGYNACGLEISASAVKFAIENFGDYYLCQDLFKYSELNPGLYDIIVLTEVIEHLIDPFEFIESTARLLKPQGKIIITTPNKSIYPANIIWATDLPPVHFWWFSEKSMVSIAKKMNLTIDFIDFSRFYRKNLITVNLNKNKNQKKPVFSKNGELIIKDSSEQKLKGFSLKRLVFKIPYCKWMYLNVRHIVDSNLIIAGKKSRILCVILSK